MLTLPRNTANGSSSISSVASVALLGRARRSSRARASVRSNSIMARLVREAKLETPNGACSPADRPQNPISAGSKSASISATELPLSARTPFGTWGSQVQILRLRPALSARSKLPRQYIRQCYVRTHRESDCREPSLHALTPGRRSWANTCRADGFHMTSSARLSAQSAGATLTNQ